MRIDCYFDDFIESLRYSRDLQKTARNLLKGKKSYCLPQMPGYEESEYLDANIRDSVKALPRGKDTAVSVYKKLVLFLKTKGIDVSAVFPPVPIDSSFERQMFIAKYLQDEDARIEHLEDILWVSERTVSQDLQRLYRGAGDPIQICGRPFFIPDSKREKGQIRSASTVHPLFLAENLTQVIVMLKGLRHMAENPVYARYAEATASDIWQQLSDYAKKRIHFVLTELLPEDLTWYEGLQDRNDHFITERDCSVNGNVWMDCIKNGKPFFVEYREDGGTVFYEDCIFIPRSLQSSDEEIIIEVQSRQGIKTLQSSRVIRSVYSIEELISD